MSKSAHVGLNRREFLIQSGLAATVAAGGLIGTGCVSNHSAKSRSSLSGVTIYQQGPQDSVSTSGPAIWAIQNLRNALQTKGVQVRITQTDADLNPNDLCIGVTALNWLIDALAKKPQGPESVAIIPLKSKEIQHLYATGNDSRGMTYALCELTDVVSNSNDAITALLSIKQSREYPANAVRSIMRSFSSDIEDNQWFNDRKFWDEYLTMLVSNRFNRFNLALGIGYDFARELKDTYFYFAYPFLLDAPGYEVRASKLSNSERDRNLEMLRYISDQTVARGLEFQLGLWTHAYIWENSPDVNHVIEGLSADKHASYCRDALALLLKECPNISGVTMRIHGESGVPEGSYDFWKTVFSGAVLANRNIRLDLHAKGIDQGIIDTALSTGLPVTISPKYWAEHMGLPYHQAAIRPTELPTRQRGSSGLMALSTGARSFTRYGYGDLLDDDRKYAVVHRMWPGTQRVLLWGDPTFAAAYSRSSSFCGSAGCELMEPMSFKGRKGSGVAGGRNSYADSSLQTTYDFQKYNYYYRLWGRLLYNPDANPESWQRYLKKEYGVEAAAPVEQALANSSRILPLFTTAHTPAAANNNYWPEMYVNQSIIDGARKLPYTEQPVPSRFGTVSPLDPQLFSRIEDEVQSLLDKKPREKYAQAEVASWLEELASNASKNLSAAQAKLNGAPATPAFKRMAIDVTVASELGNFFAHKIRAASLWAIYEKGGHSRSALEAAIKSYRSARNAWARIVQQTRGVYLADVSYGIDWFQRGHWADRLPLIDSDIAAMEALLPNATDAAVSDGMIAAILHPTGRPALRVKHQPPAKFRRGLPLSLTLEGNTADKLGAQCVCFYRRTHQAESWNNLTMDASPAGWNGQIPAGTTDSRFPVQYYFQITSSDGHVSLYPGFNTTLSNQPYFAVRSV